MLKFPFDELIQQKTSHNLAPEKKEQIQQKSLNMLRTMNFEISTMFSRLLPTVRQIPDVIDKMKVAMEVPENFALIRVQLATFERDNQNLRFK